MAGQWTKKACPQVRPDATRTSETSKWSPEHVQDVCSFIERLPHVEGRWTTATIQLQPWQVFILAACYGFRQAGRLRGW